METGLSPVELVERFVQALRDRDIKRAGHYLAAQGFEYSSPTHHFTSAASLVSYLELTIPIVHTIETRRRFVDGQDVCHVLRVVSQISERRSSDVVQWARTASGEIRRIEMFYDAFEYRRLFVTEEGSQPDP